MSPRSAFVVSALFPLVLSAGCGSGERPPNIVLVVIDTLRADHCSTFGYERETTPNLSRLAERGIRFENAWAQAPWTLPSMVSFFTGRYVLANYDAVPEGAITLPERLASSGYDTAAVVANPLLFEGSGFDRGFRRYEVATHAKGRKTMRGDDVVRLTRELLSGDLEEPFFLWVHLYDPHYPYRPPLRHHQKGQVAVSERMVEDYRSRQPRGAETASEEDVHILEKVIQKYDGEVAYADAALGDILTALEDKGYLDRTICAVTADHGEGLFSHAEIQSDGDRTKLGLYIGHGDHMYEEALHIPLVLAGPGVAVGETSSELVENTDLYATLLAASGNEGDAGTSGQDLLGERPGRSAVFSFGTRNHAVRTRQGMKLIFPVKTVEDTERVSRPVLLAENKEDFAELFDLREDPDERRQVWRKQPDKASFLLDLLRRWQAKHREDLGDTSGKSREMSRRLRELGYTR